MEEEEEDEDEDKEQHGAQVSVLGFFFWVFLAFSYFNRDAEAGSIITP